MDLKRRESLFAIGIESIFRNLSEKFVFFSEFMISFDARGRWRPKKSLVGLRHPEKLCCGVSETRYVRESREPALPAC